MFESDHYSHHYNALTDVVYADQSLEQLGRASILDRLSSVILDHGLEETYGIRLLHTHHAVHAGEWMIEEEEVLSDGGHALTTRADAIDRCGTRTAASIWMFADGMWLRMEYSADASALETDPIERHPAFTADFARVLTEAGVEGILGLCAARRHFFATRRAGGRESGYGLLETTDANRCANILRFADLDTYPADTLIQTVWLATTGEEADCPVGGFK